jgi:hypothetical protein
MKRDNSFYAAATPKRLSTLISKRRASKAGLVLSTSAKQRFSLGEFTPQDYGDALAADDPGGVRSASPTRGSLLQIEAAPDETETVAPKSTSSSAIAGGTCTLFAFCPLSQTHHVDSRPSLVAPRRSGDYSKSVPAAVSRQT